MASGFRCLSLRASCPSAHHPIVRTKNSNQQESVTINNRIYGASQGILSGPFNNGIQCYVDKPKVTYSDGLFCKNLVV